MRTIPDAVLSLQRFFGGILSEPWDVRTDLETGHRPPRPFALIEVPTADATTGAPSQRIVTFTATANLYLAEEASREAATDAALALREQVAMAVDWGDPDSWRPTTDRIPLWAYDPRLAVQRVNVRGAEGGSWLLEYGDEWTDAIPYDGAASDVLAALDPLSAGNFECQDRATGIVDVYFVGALAGVTQELLGLNAEGLEWPAYPFQQPVPGVTVVQDAQPPPWRARSDYMKVESFGQTTVHDEGNERLVMVAVDLRLTFTKARPLPLNRRLLERITAVEPAPFGEWQLTSQARNRPKPPVMSRAPRSARSHRPGR